jgi:hypothetical protein
VRNQNSCCDEHGSASPAVPLVQSLQPAANGPCRGSQSPKTTSRLELKESRNALFHISPIGIHRRNAFNAKVVPCILYRVSISLALPHRSWNRQGKLALG